MFKAAPERLVSGADRRIPASADPCGLKEPPSCFLVSHLCFVLASTLLGEFGAMFDGGWSG